ncbi:PLDc N-terminal domain-containing protein [Patescibacteria group bacterium]|nr:PLDc N-terminal domain-containing protein [Patescibacteria group bacterium]
MLVVGVFSLLVFALWLWMLIDVISREEKDFPSSGSDQKVLWILILVFGNWIGAFVYYLVVFKKSPKSK